MGHNDFEDRLEEKANEVPDLWRGHGIKPTNWPDIEEAISVARQELSEGLHTKALFRVSRAQVYLNSVQEILKMYVEEIKA